jgi:hypothetical protein
MLEGKDCFRKKIKQVKEMRKCKGVEPKLSFPLFLFFFFVLPSYSA